MKRVLAMLSLTLLLIPGSIFAQTAVDKLIQGIGSYNELQWEDAISSLNDALQLGLSGTSRIQAYKYLGFCYIEINQLDKAKEEFENLLDLDSDFRLDLDISSRYRDIFKIVKSEFRKSAPGSKTQQVETDTGSISAESIPSSAQVSLDDVLQEGRTPMTIEDVTTGQHLLKLTLNGYKDWEKMISVEAKKTAEINARLIPMPRRETQRIPAVKKGGKLKWYLLSGTVVAAGGGVAAFLLLRGDSDDGPIKVGDDGPKTTSLNISIGFP